MITHVKKQVDFKDLGLIDYQKAYYLQKENVNDVIHGGLDKVLICEHPTVLTMGRMAKEENILCSQSELRDNAINIISVDRGGDVTLHSHGQLIAYFIFNLNNKRDLRKHLHCLEQVAIDFLAEFGILANRNLLNTGAWVGDEKIASIGIGVKKWVTYHGLAININTDLNLFSYIKPCDLEVQMTSIRQISGQITKMDVAKEVLRRTIRNTISSSEIEYE